MTLRSIYEAALRMLGESECTLIESELEERAPYICSALCTEAAALDRAYREAFGMKSVPCFAGLHLELDAVFPLCDRFAPAAAFYMAAMLILDEDVDLYEKFFDRWCDALATINAEIPFIKGSTVNVYGC